MKKIVVILALSVFTTASYAGVLITGNLGGSATGSGNYSDFVERAVGFNAPASGAFDLGSIVLNVQSGTPIVSLFNNNVNEPGTAYSISWNTSQAGNLYTFQPASTFSLTSGATYWVVVSAASGQGGNWNADGSYTSDTTPTGSWFGANKSRFGGNFGTWSTDGNQYMVNINAVPEPSHYAMLAGLGLVAFAVIRRKMKA